MNPSIPEVRGRFSRYLARHPAWGSLHIVLADGNVHDSNVLFCIDHAAQQGDSEGRALAEILLLMSKTQRRKLSTVVI